jgi:Zn-dependent protease/predicted transcriptional regulator
MRWNLKIGTYGGTEVRIHVTFFLLLLWVAWMYYLKGGWIAAFDGVFFTCLVCLCVLLHEFGHALAARRYGIRTPDITLMPIGGVARLERMPDNPVQELVVALAGPAVNVCIVVVLYLLLMLTVAVPGEFPLPTLMEDPAVGLLLKLLGVNVWLILFNMVPAFPMDGGRVLRALLAMKLPYSRATNIAAAIGQGLAFLFGLVGLVYLQPLWILVAVFVYLGAANEASFAQMRSVSQGLRVRNAMVTDFRELSERATLDEALEVLLQGSQQDFPVVDPFSRVTGLLLRADLFAALKSFGGSTPVSNVMRTDIPAVTAHTPFDKAFEMMNSRGLSALPVLDSEARVIGLFTTENVGELMMIHSLTGKFPERPVTADRARVVRAV